MKVMKEKEEEGERLNSTNKNCSFLLPIQLVLAGVIAAKGKQRQLPQGSCLEGTK